MRPQNNTEHIQSYSGKNLGTDHDIHQNDLKDDIKSKVNRDIDLAITKIKQPDMIIKKQNQPVKAKDKDIIRIEDNCFEQKHFKYDEKPKQISDNNMKNIQIQKFIINSTDNSPVNVKDDEILVIEEIINENKYSNDKNPPVHRLDEEIIVLEEDSVETANSLVGISVEEAIKFFN